MKVHWKPPKDSPLALRQIPGPGDLIGVKGGTLYVEGKVPDGGPWVVALGYAVALGCSVVRT